MNTRPISDSAVSDVSSYDTSVLLFYVNGVRVEESSVDPMSTLAVYLRDKLGLTGTKIGCNEGGCGACTVMLSERDPVHGRIRHYSCNSCLTPVCAVFGKAVTTVEGLGNVRENRLHPVQERLSRLRFPPSHAQSPLGKRTPETPMTPAKDKQPAELATSGSWAAAMEHGTENDKRIPAGMDSSRGSGGKGFGSAGGFGTGGISTGGFTGRSNSTGSNSKPEQPSRVSAADFLSIQHGIDKKLASIADMATSITAGIAQVNNNLVTLNKNDSNTRDTCTALAAQLDEMRIGVNQLDVNLSKRISAIDTLCTGIAESVNNMRRQELKEIDEAFNKQLGIFMKELDGKAKDNSADAEVLKLVGNASDKLCFIFREVMARVLKQDPENDKKENEHSGIEDITSSQSAEVLIPRSEVSESGKESGRGSKRGSPEKEDESCQGKRSRRDSGSSSISGNHTLFGDEEASEQFAKPAEKTSRDFGMTKCIFCNQDTHLPPSLAKKRYEILSAQRRCTRCCYRIDPSPTGFFKPHDRNICKEMRCKFCNGKAGVCGGAMCRQTTSIRWDMDFDDMIVQKPYGTGN